MVSIEHVLFLCFSLDFFTILLCQETYKKPIYNTKTPYFWVKDLNESIPENQFSSVVYNDEICQLNGLDVLFRHGGRYPTLHWIVDMTALKTKLGADPNVVQRYPFIKIWKNPFPLAKQAMLSVLGENEMLNLGRRFGRRFKAAFDINQDQSRNLAVAVTRKSRTRTSFEHFLRGLNETVYFRNHYATAKEDNMKLRFYDFCHKYITDVEGSSRTQYEYNKFLVGPEMTQVLRKIKNKLGSYDVTSDEVLVMHQICVMELGILNQSDWCELFDIDDLFVIEYMQSIQNFYELEYAYPINWQQSCPYTSKIFRKYDVIVNQQNYRETSVNLDFGHAKTVLPIVTAFGLSNNSKPLLADNYHLNKDRKYKESLIAPFSANIAIALYRCSVSNDHVIKIFLNEAEVTIPACGQNICTYSDFKSFYNSLANCNFDKICENSTNPPPVG